jgi:hypothetical protein
MTNNDEFDEGHVSGLLSRRRASDPAAAVGGDFTGSGGHEDGPPFPFAEGRGAFPPFAPCSEPPQLAVVSRGDGEREAGRTQDDDERIALHEASHAVTGRLLGQPLGGVTIIPADGYSGRCWGPEFESRFATGETAPSLCARISALMPGPGESRADIAVIMLHVHSRVVELCAGSVGERLFCDGEPWHAADDRKQERALAALVASSPEAIEAFISFACIEAATLLRDHAHVVRALAAELLIRRTLDGEQIDLVIAEAISTKAAEVEMRRSRDWDARQASAALLPKEIVA